jgi:hypothetical protein
MSLGGYISKLKKGANRIVDTLQRGEKAIHPHRKHRFRSVRNPLLPHPKSDCGESLLVRGYKQLDSYGCGSIAGFIVLQSIYPNVRWEDFYAHCAPHPVHGLGDKRLLTALRGFGLTVSTNRGAPSFSKIKRSIAEGCPILATHDCPEDPASDSDPAHWVAIYGWSEGEEKMVYIANPVYENPMPYLKFRELAKDYKSYICWGRV